MKKQILIIAATHGDEKIGLEIIDKLERAGWDEFFDWIIGNPWALKRKTRFVEKDLNRSYPGSKKSKIYEERIAYENFKAAKKYRYVIDIHEASSGINDFIIVPRKKLTKKFPVRCINLRKILLWPDPKGPLSQYLDQALELEFGMKNRNRQQVVEKGERIIKSFIKNLNARKAIKRKQDIYQVYDKLMCKNVKVGTRLKDFKLSVRGGESFYPLLVGQYTKEGIFCYKMKLKNFN